MGAPAQAKTPKTPRTPAWAREKLVVKPGWTLTPNPFFTALPQRLGPGRGLAYMLVGQLLQLTYGSEERLAWCCPTQERLAKSLGVSVTAIQQNLADFGKEFGSEGSAHIIEWQKQGKKLWFRLRVDNFATAAPNEAPKTEKVETKAPARVGHELQSLVVLPGRGQTVTLEQAVRSIRYRNDGPAQANLGQRLDGDVLELFFQPAEALQATPKNTQIHQAGLVYSESDLTAYCNAILKKTGVLGRLKRLPTAADYRKVKKALKNASLEQFGGLLEEKASKVQNYALLVPLAEECAASADDWNAWKAEQAAQQQPRPCDDLEARLEARAAQLATELDRFPTIAQQIRDLASLPPDKLADRCYEIEDELRRAAPAAIQRDEQAAWKREIAALRKQYGPQTDTATLERAGAVNVLRLPSIAERLL